MYFAWSFCYSQSEPKWKWERINYTFPGDVNILSVVSGNDFWVRTTEGDLIHYKNGEAKTYRTIISQNYTRLCFTAVKQDEFIASAMDIKWRTHFYHFSNGKWTEDSFVFRLPIQSIHSINSNRAYAAGNFGTLLKYENKKWEELKTPLKSHINSVEVVSPHEIFLLTNSEGVFLFDGNTFKNIPFPEKNKWDIQQLRMLSKDKIFARDSKRKLYRYKDSRFIYDNDEKNKIVFATPDNPTYRDIVLMTSHSSDFPMRIPSIYMFNDLKSYHKDSILFAERGGVIYKAGITTGNYFTNFSKVLGIESDNFTTNHIAAIYDFDKNGLPDILSVSRSLTENISFYYNSANVPFQKEVMPPFNREQTLGPSAAFLDYNCDTYTDFVIANSDSDGISLILFENNKKGNFIKRETIPLSIYGNLHQPVNLKPVDIDADGRMDICVTYYYGPAEQTGYEFIIKNSFFSGLSEIDTTTKSLTRSWNTQSLFADFNKDDLNDWIIANKWRKNKLLINKNGTFKDESEKRIHPLNLSESIGTCAADFDNDGDLDVLIISDHSFISLLKNNGNGYFTDATADFGLDKFTPGHSILAYTTVALGDFNNDGFTDIFLVDANSKSARNFLLLNQQGKCFIDQAKEMQITAPILQYAIANDMDDDGDVDIFCYGINGYTLWLNNLDNKSFLKIRPLGVIANSEGWGTKIWVYENGHLDNRNYLKGYKQLGSEIFGNTQNCENVAHFGVDPNKLYEVRVKFYGGKEIVLRDLKPGQSYNVKELSDLATFFYSLPRIAVRIFRSTEVQIYIFITLITFFILYFGTKNGLYYYHWNTPLALSFVSLSISLYWLILLLTLNSPSSFLKYFLPGLMSVVSIVIPNLVFLWITHNQHEVKSSEKIKDDLLDELMQFSHGAWGLSNLNSLQLLSEHADDNLDDTKYMDTFSERMHTFQEMVQPRLLSIVDLATTIHLGKESIDHIKRSINFLIEIEHADNSTSYHNFASEFSNIKESLSELKKIVYASYSCDPILVIKNTCASLEHMLTENNVLLNKSKHFEGDHAVLIKNYELADIIDNCLQNSVRALKENEPKRIAISIYKRAPKICIDITDNGSGINKNDWEKIFESGYSKGASSGFGLFSAQTKLKKYGGRIFVKSSVPRKETTLTIELNEGIM